MKKQAFSTALLLATFLGTALGQMGFGLSSGANLSTAHFANVDGADTRFHTGYFVGLGANYRFNSKFQISADVQYSQKGYGVEYNGGRTGHRYAYIDLLPEVEYHVLDFLSVGTGISYGFRLSEEWKTAGQDWEKLSEVKYLTKPTDFGLTAKVKANYHDMFCFVRYVHGLVNISDAYYTDDNGDVIGKAKQLSRNVQLGIGYNFGF
jgi:hypothetical protein